MAASAGTYTITDGNAPAGTRIPATPKRFTRTPAVRREGQEGNY